jgi:hypothetical protein
MVEQMPVYFFNLRDGHKLEKDPEGGEFASLIEAREEIILAAREMMASKVASGEKIDGKAFEITNEDGVILETVPVRSVVLFE